METQVRNIVLTTDNLDQSTKFAKFKLEFECNKFLTYEEVKQLLEKLK